VNSARLYVGNLSCSASEERLRRLFGSYGEVASVNLITHPDSGQRKGFCYVEMGSAEQAQAAKDALDGSQLNGRALKVDIARRHVARTPRPGDG
jgi:cold-inducible RNA-binding protein